MSGHQSLPRGGTFLREEQTQVSTVFVLRSSEMQMEQSWSFLSKGERQILVGLFAMCSLGIAS